MLIQREHQKFGPYWKLQRVAYKVNKELRSELSLNEDNSHSLVRISHGVNKLFTNLNDNELETSEVQFEEHAIRLNVLAFACRKKAKAKPQRREFVNPTRIIPIGERIWTDVEPEEYSLSDYDISKKVIRLHRDAQQVLREEDGAVHFWRKKENFQKHFPHCLHWSIEMWKTTIAGGGGNKKTYQYCIDSSREMLYFRGLQVHLGRSLDDPSLQYNVVIPSNFFQYIHHVGCASKLHSITDSGLIPGGRNLSKRQTVFFLLVDPMDKNLENFETINLEAPCLAQCMHTAWKNIRILCIGST